jgi:hypothetical protein
METSFVDVHRQPKHLGNGLNSLVAVILVADLEAVGLPSRGALRVAFFLLEHPAAGY